MKRLWICLVCFVGFTTKMPVSAAGSVKRRWFRSAIGKRVGPGGFEINGIREHKARGLSYSARRNQIANPLACLVGDPLVDVFAFAVGTFSEIHLLKRRAIKFLHQFTKSCAKVVAALHEQSIGDGNRYRLARSASFPGLLGSRRAPFRHFFERTLERSE